MPAFMQNLAQSVKYFSQSRKRAAFLVEKYDNDMMSTVLIINYDDIYLLFYSLILMDKSLVFTKGRMRMLIISESY